MLNYLDNIHCSEDIKKLSLSDLALLADEIREYLIAHVSKTGGHLASNLGVVEITLAIHNVFDSEKDRILFDVGHQSYVHKLITGRKDTFDTLRRFGGLSGFPKPSESKSDAFTAGHASSAVSTALGMARAAKIQNQDYSVVAVVGDGAAGGGIFYEAMNDAGSGNIPLIVVLNDNGMSISDNVGSISRHLKKLRLKPAYFGLKKKYRKITSYTALGRAIYKGTHQIKQWLKRSLLGQTVFEEMGFVYLGPVDGHDVRMLSWLLKRAKEENCPVLIHAITKKGKGYKPAEENPSDYHGVSPFDPLFGIEANSSKIGFSDVVGQLLSHEAYKNDKICAITAGMTSGTGLSDFECYFPKRFFDVGIAEEHAVSMAAGMAKQGLIPVLAIYSTFLQRSYDMLLQDLGLQRLHVVLLVDRCGIVGNDGETHHGMYDMGFLRQIPGITIFSPATYSELEIAFHTAISLKGPAAVRYPRGGELDIVKKNIEGSFPPSRAITIFTYGILIREVLAAADRLEEKGIEVTIIRPLQVYPLDESAVISSCEKTGNLLILEEQAEACCIGYELASRVLTKCPGVHCAVKNAGGDFLPHGSREEILKSCSLDSDNITKAALEVMGYEP